MWNPDQSLNALFCMDIMFDVTIWTCLIDDILFYIGFVYAICDGARVMQWLHGYAGPEVHTTDMHGILDQTEAPMSLVSFCSEASPVQVILILSVKAQRTLYIAW